MQQPSILAGKGRTSHQVRHILLIDDNVHLRSLLARQIMLCCGNNHRTCAIYRLGERAEPTLTYFYDPQEPDVLEPGLTPPDFVLYEASSPRHALAWLYHAPLKHLTIISDVMMPVDTEVGLPGLLNGLQELKIAVNLVFISSEAQNLAQVQTMLKGLPVYFLIKGSEAWNRLPDALVAGANRFNFQVLPKQNYSNPAIFQPVELSPDETLLPSSARPARYKRMSSLNNVALSAATADYATARPVPKAPGFWARLFGLGRGRR